MRMKPHYLRTDRLPCTLSRVGLRCGECDFRLRRPRRLTRRLDEAYAWRCLTHGKSTVSDGLGRAAKDGLRECVAVAAALRSRIELVPKVRGCSCARQVTPDGGSQ